MVITLRLPQIIWLVMVIPNLAVSLVKHGEPQDDYNFWRTLIGVSISTGILIAGGFFTV